MILIQVLDLVSIQIVSSIWFPVGSGSHLDPKCGSGFGIWFGYGSRLKLTIADSMLEPRSRTSFGSGVDLGFRSGSESDLGLGILCLAGQDLTRCRRKEDLS